MRGRKPKPTAQKLAEGDTHKVGVHKLEQQLSREPKAAAGLPSCPRHLTGRARSAWKFWAEELAFMNLDRRPDAIMLEGACVGYASAVQADLIIADEGPVCTHITVDPQTGHEMQKLKAHPAVSISRSGWSQVRSFCSEFGLSPVSRTRLSIEKRDDGAADLARLLNGPRASKLGAESVQ